MQESSISLMTREAAASQTVSVKSHFHLMKTEQSFDR